ncbi:hypothetical protein AGR2A_Lc60195 [Agrobacterium genomosp. 2 str. CFBP 5494]|uniref:Uncharacterized protein n=1 Tax=Agrobacterium genomosp. 2 str. CFBP 5494 TaxID=1183436 RepID=A0A9W5B510_9HYPH|nr:hypothetical protein AGR2A_Lc60195 [Agrobacterium genomosp. 2 str. CFBP 5494]
MVINEISIAFRLAAGVTLLCQKVFQSRIV